METNWWIKTIASILLIFIGARFLNDKKGPFTHRYWLGMILFNVGLWMHRHLDQ